MLKLDKQIGNNMLTLGCKNKYLPLQRETFKSLVINITNKYVSFQRNTFSRLGCGSCVYSFVNITY